jgi:hypothetical protein
MRIRNPGFYTFLAYGSGQHGFDNQNKLGISEFVMDPVRILSSGYQM